MAGSLMMLLNSLISFRLGSEDSHTARHNKREMQNSRRNWKIFRSYVGMKTGRSMLYHCLLYIKTLPS
jgi:hypothetical protein